MKTILLFLSIISFSCFGQSNKPIPLPPGIFKLSGLWEMKDENGTAYEYWEINQDSTMRGFDYVLGKNNDTIIFEMMKIISKDSNIYFIANIPDQNEGKPVYFKLIEFTPMVFVFENKQHDFPQMITYSRKTDDLYSVVIEGPDNGKIKSVEFRFSRKQITNSK